MKYMSREGQCSEKECERPVRSRGLCSRHYDRAVRKGVCPKCGGEKSRRDSYVLCGSCRVSLWDEWPEKKTCPSCQQEKSSTEFGIRQDRRSNKKLRSRCKECESKATGQYLSSLDPEVRAERRQVARRREKEQHAALPPEKRFWKSIRLSARHLGFDPDVIVEYVKQQGNVCEACSKECTYERLGRVVLDHNHETGEFRGLLCGSCNFVAGHSYDNPEILRGVADYLESRGTDDGSRNQQRSLRGR